MIVVILVAGFIIGSLLMWTLAKAAGDADKRLDELYQAFLLNISYITDVKANAKGYEQLAMMGLRKMKKLA